MGESIDKAKLAKKWSKHSFQIQTEVLERFIHFAETLGVKKYEALEEALADYFDKHALVVDKINQIKEGSASTY